MPNRDQSITAWSANDINNKMQQIRETYDYVKDYDHDYNKVDRSWYLHYTPVAASGGNQIITSDINRVIDAFNTTRSNVMSKSNDNIGDGGYAALGHLGSGTVVSAPFVNHLYNGFEFFRTYCNYAECNYSGECNRFECCSAGGSECNGGSES